VRKMTLIFLSTFFAALILVASVNAGECCCPRWCQRAKPTVVNCRFSAATEAVVNQGKVWWTGHDTILHVRGLVTELSLLYFLDYGDPTTMPPVNPTVWLIGTLETMTNFDFNTKTGKGIAVSDWTMTFVEPTYFTTDIPVGEPNPVGLGTLEGKEVSKVTSLFDYPLNFKVVPPGVFLPGDEVIMPGDATGFVVATHGTGDFEKATLMAKTTSYPTYVENFMGIGLDFWTEDTLVGWDGVLPATATGILMFHK
jgi:hypothetical protein